ncbi:TonB-dependent receptor plug domain-containing protein [Reichenbachiella sp. MALMAid0571]|uniref:TonB-dependent receptor plug domain-containing protein n=1 Tax=Reichenbachiella sp. MALMAid0571 TaxID=3143939 RepID=UPI0032DE2FCC
MRELQKIRTKTLAIAGATLLCFHNTLAQENNPDIKELPLDRVVVTGTKFDLPIEKSGKSIYKLTNEDIERNSGKSLSEVLNEVPGIQIDGNFGTPGTNLSYYLRGGRDKNTLILIDGVPLNDPSGINATYDLRYLPLNQVESIEVLKGGLSTLYGTGASAGVINIKLKEATQESLSGQIRASAGSYSTYGTSGNLNGTTDKFSYFVYGNYLSSGGFSAASDENSSSKFAKDGFKQKNALVKLGYKFSDSFNLDFLTGYDDIEADYDNDAFTDGNNQQLNNQVRVGITPSYKYDKGKISLKALINLNDKEFISDYPSHDKGKNIQTDLVHEHQINDYLKGLWGVNIQKMAYKVDGANDFSDNNFTIIDPYASLFFENNTGLNVHAGLRLNSHSVYDSKLLYNINPSYLIEATDAMKIKVLASIGTSYITPSLYQLYSAYGNSELTPEESLNYEGGVSLYVNKNVEFNFTYFKREETNPIGWDSSRGDFGGYANLGEDRTVSGYETNINWNIVPKWMLAVNYTHTESDQTSTFYRIPKDKFGFTLNFDATDYTNISAKYNYTSSRTVQDFSTWPATEVVLDSYSIVDILIQQKTLNDRLKFFGAVNNILDHDFIGVLGFTTRGRNFNIGLTYNF